MNSQFSVNTAAEPPEKPAPPPRRSPAGTPRSAPRDPAALTLHAVFLGLACGVLLLSFLLRLDRSQAVTLPGIDAPLPPLCLYRRFAGVDCPGCGLTRAFVSLAHGRIAEAWHFNPGGIPLFLLVAGQIPYRLGQLWRLRRGLPPWPAAYFHWVIAPIVLMLLVPWLAKTGAQLFGWW